MKTYLVGESVRDRLLGLPVAQPEHVIVGASAGVIAASGYTPVPGPVPSFRRVGEPDLYRVACRRVTDASGRPGLAWGPDVGLGEDLRRRDLTLDAMALAPDGDLVDPFGGEDDLRDGVLRHASPDFAVEPANPLRVAVYAARYHRWGFRVAHGTNALMRRMARLGVLAALPAEARWRWTLEAFQGERPDRYLRVLSRGGALDALAPELAAGLGGADAPAHGEGDPAALERLSRACARTADPVCRIALLVSLRGRGAAAGEAAPAWLAGLGAPEDVRGRVAALLRRCARLDPGDDGLAEAILAGPGCAGP